MGFQFAHIEGYARVGASQNVKEIIKVVDPATGKVVKKETGKVTKQESKSMVDICEEAERVAGAIPHIEDPEPPKLLFGVMPLQVVPMAEQWALQAKDAKGRKLRKDAPCLLAGVLSLPRDMEDEFHEFAADSIAWLKDKYGDRLKSVIAHDDEEHPHLHFYVVPEIGEDFEAIHEGVKASRQAKAQGKLKSEQNQAYKEAMRGFQDRFYEGVGVRFGLARLGPGRRRLSRAAWKAEKATNKAQAQAIAQAGKAKEQAAGLIAQAMERAKQIYKDAKDKGYKRGKEKARAETIQMGAKVGNVLTGLLGSFHQPTAQALTAKKEAEKQAEEEKKAREKAEQEAKQEADKRVTKIAQELHQVKANRDDLSKELTKQTEANGMLGAVVAWYEKRFGPAPNDIKPK